jgi:asparagine synthase (glutamine-hydrolysing)
MCGICGIVQFDGAPVDRGLLELMTASISHRGPDGSGTYVSHPVGLGHRRLSIIDLEGGAQPIGNEDGSVQVVFNGEIYNYVELRQQLLAKGHTFATRSDTEVIIHGYEEWGESCVGRFNGIFAFALWDVRRRTLLAARDHLGVKPLYYAIQDGQLLLASEIKALLKSPSCPREVHLPALAKLFTVRYVPCPDTLFRGILKLPPGHLLVAGPDGVETRRYWQWRPVIRETVDEQSLVEQYRDLLQDAVRLQMRSDVPVGLYLSSGVDSATLLAMMNRHAGKAVHTFTIGFEGGEATNETADARRIAERFGADHAEMIIGPADYERYYERFLWDLEEPVGHEPAVAFFFLSQLASRRVKVVLCGQGADEPWAGYHRCIGIKLSQFYSRLPAAITRPVTALIDRFGRSERLIRGVHSLAEKDVLSRILKVYSFYHSGMKEELYQPWLKQSVGIDEGLARDALARLQTDVRHLDPLTQMLYIDTRASLPDDLLMVADKLSMANGVEARVPYLDYRVVEFVETLPAHLKLRRFQGKYLHKKAVLPWVSREVAYRPKKGFAHPVARWLGGRMRTFVGDCLLSETSRLSRYFNREYIRKMVSDHESGRQPHLRHLYLLISFELWHRRFLPA